MRRRLLPALAFLLLAVAGCLVIRYQIRLELDGSGSAAVSYRLPEDLRRLAPSTFPDFPTSAAQLRRCFSPQVKILAARERDAGGTHTVEADLEFDWLGDLSGAEHLFLYFPSQQPARQIRIVIRRGALPIELLRRKLEERLRSIPRFANQKPEELAEKALAEGGVFINLELPGAAENCRGADCQGNRADVHASLLDLEKAPYKEAVIYFRPGWQEKLNGWRHRFFRRQEEQAAEKN